MPASRGIYVIFSFDGELGVMLESFAFYIILAIIRVAKMTKIKAITAKIETTTLRLTLFLFLILFLLLAALVENALVFESFLAISYPFCQKSGKDIFSLGFLPRKKN